MIRKSFAAALCLLVSATALAPGALAFEAAYSAVCTDKSHGSAGWAGAKRGDKGAAQNDVDDHAKYFQGHRATISVSYPTMYHAVCTDKSHGSAGWTGTKRSDRGAVQNDIDEHGKYFQGHRATAQSFEDK